MTSVNELFPRARKLVYDLEQQMKEVAGNALCLCLSSLARLTVEVDSGAAAG